MKPIKNIFLLCCTLLYIHNVVSLPAISYAYSDNIGRLGDQIMLFFKSKWTAYKNNLPFYFVPFIYSEQLNVHYTEPHLTEDIKSSFTHIKQLWDIEAGNYKDSNNTLYLLDYGTTSGKRWQPLLQHKEWRHFDSMFREFNKHPKFVAQLQSDLKPTTTLNLISPPSNCISIAVHARTGGDYWWDHDDTNPHKYLRFLPHSYYAHQISLLLKHFKSQPLYVFIFTDDKHPDAIIKYYKKIINHPNITWDYRSQGTNHDTFVLDDLFSMAQFNCLIRPWSQFSRLAEFIGNHKFVTYPIEHYIKDNKHIITYHMRNHHGKVIKTDTVDFVKLTQPEKQTT